MFSNEQPPMLVPKPYSEDSIFTVSLLLQGARAQKQLPDIPVPPVCVLDPDGDLVDYLQRTQRAERLTSWACYHTRLDIFILDGHPIGIVGRAVGAPFAVLVAEELFASGCQLLISITSAGQIIPLDQLPYFVLIEYAWRDEGTSYHYLPPSPYSELSPKLSSLLLEHWDHHVHHLYRGASWTTDAPFRETQTNIEKARAQGLVAVEMESAALYALAQAHQRDIICFAHLTNQLGQSDTDFEKGQHNGSLAALTVIQEAARIWRMQYPVFVDTHSEDLQQPTDQQEKAYEHASAATNAAMG